MSECREPRALKFRCPSELLLIPSKPHKLESRWGGRGPSSFKCQIRRPPPHKCEGIACRIACLDSSLADTSDMETSPTCMHAHRILQILSLGDAIPERGVLRGQEEIAPAHVPNASTLCFDLGSSGSSSFPRHGMQRLGRLSSRPFARLTVSIIVSSLTQGVIDTHRKVPAWKPVLCSYFLHLSCPTSLRHELVCDDSPTKLLTCGSMLQPTNRLWAN